MLPWPSVACAVAAYLVGSISFGLLIAKRHGVDLRRVGSGNIGATNVGRALGRRASRMVLVLDALKGALPVAVARHFLDTPPLWIALIGVAAVLGHLVPVWHGFRGGKGAATGVGVLLAAVPPAGAAAAATYFALRRITRRSSVGSLGAAAVGAAVTAVLHRDSPLTWLSGAIAVLIVIRHVDNIGRLLRGTEPPA